MSAVDPMEPADNKPSAVKRALKAIESPRPTSTRGAAPKGSQAGIMVCQRIDPRVVIELDELTGHQVNEAVTLFVFVARSAKRGAQDAVLANIVRSWLRKAAA